MHLVSRCRQLVMVGNAFVSFAEGEPLVSEYSHKYTPQAFAAQARAAGWRVEQAWTDPRGWFSVRLLLPAHASITWGAVRDQCAPPRRETEPLDTA